MSIDQIYDKFDSIGTANVTLFCSTTPAHIYYQGAVENGRMPIKPVGVQVQAIPYMVRGRIVCTESIDQDYLVLTYEGEAPLFWDRGDGLKLSPDSVTKIRTMHVPVSAIKRITVNS